MVRNSKGGLAAVWGGLYMLFYNMPWLPELVHRLNNAWLIGLTVSDTHLARREELN